jgi:hypothetical protein
MIKPPLLKTLLPFSIVLALFFAAEGGFAQVNPPINPPINPPTPSSGAKPYAKVLVLSGGGLDAAVYMGIIQGLANRGWQPDLILATCGSSIPAAILQAKGSLQDAKRFLDGDDYRRLVQSVELKRPNVLSVVGSIYSDPTDKVPHLFGKTVLSVPKEWPKQSADNDLLKTFDQARTQQSPGTAVAILAAHAYLGPQYVGSEVKGRKTIREAIFTDTSTAGKIAQTLRESFVAKNFPKSYIDEAIEFNTQSSLFYAARASVSDPYLISPIEVPDPAVTSVYLTGGVDLFPVDMANQLGDQVIAVYGAAYSGIEVRANKNAFGYDSQKRLQQMVSQKIFAWVDMSDEDQWGPKIGFDPRVSWLSLVSAVPKNTELFDQKNQAQWDFGIQRAQEALIKPEGDLTHIRVPVQQPENQDQQKQTP